MEQVYNLLVDCSCPRDNDHRKESETGIQELRNSDPVCFLYYTMEVLQNDKCKEQARQLAGILFKNTLINATQDPALDNLWQDMSDEQRDLLKRNSLGALCSDNKAIIRAAATAISSICIFEIPAGSWPEVITSLNRTTVNQEENIKYASLLSLAYILEELREGELNKDDLNLIVSGLIESLDKNKESPDLIEQTIKGIFHSMKFCKQYFEKREADIIVNSILLMTKYQSVGVREVAMQCIVEIVRLCYDFIEEFMKDITDVTILATENDEPQVKTQAIDVWSSLAEEEKMRIDNGKSHSNIIRTAFGIIMEMIFSCIQEINLGNIEEDDDQEWGTSVAAGCCLNLISKVVEDDVIEPVTNFAAKNIEEDMKWEQKYCGLLSLGAILEGPDKNKLLEILTPAVPQLIDLLADSNRKVSYTAGWLFSKIAKSNHELITYADNFGRLYDQLINGLRTNNNISANICSIIAELAEAILDRENPIETCILSGVYEELLSVLKDYVLEENSGNTRVAGFSAIFNLLQYAPIDCQETSYNFMNYILDLLEESVKDSEPPSIANQELQCFFLCAVQCILTNIQADLHDDFGVRTIELVQKIFLQRQDVCEEAFLALSAVANKFPQILNHHIDSLGPFLIHGLKCESPGIIRNVCGLISDLCTLVESPIIVQEFKQYMPILLSHMKNPNIGMSVQVIIVSLIGDTFLLTKNQFEPYFEESLIILESAAKACVEIPNCQYLKKYDEIQALVQYQSSLIEAYTCFVQNIRDVNDRCYQCLGTHIYNIYNFLMSTLAPEFDHSIDFLREVGGLVGDIANTFGRNIGMEMSMSNQIMKDDNRLHQLVNILSNYDDTDTKAIADFIVSEVNKIGN
ncbi:unnamed protein product [Moneuplotes crassus]|uniref:Importin N-terminal domain-containing protein n=2 Tax=Euplotes crassus TaxID=5936 RepID=A0AAD2D7Z4_EUPCR|nr:unnamed protein product [Moneuplotes crassus]